MIYHIMILLKNDYVREQVEVLKLMLVKILKIINSLNGNVNTSY